MTWNKPLVAKSWTVQPGGPDFMMSVTCISILTWILSLFHVSHNDWKRLLGGRWGGQKLIFPNKSENFSVTSRNRGKLGLWTKSQTSQTKKVPIQRTQMFHLREVKTLAPKSYRLCGPDNKKGEGLFKLKLWK